MTADSDPFLPGLEPPEAGATRLERAAHEQIQHLRDAGLLTSDHAIAVQLVLDLSRAIGISARNGRASAMALAAKELREALALLPTATNDDAFDQLMRQLQEQTA